MRETRRAPRLCAPRAAQCAFKRDRGKGGRSTLAGARFHRRRRSSRSLPWCKRVEGLAASPKRAHTVPYSKFVKSTHERMAAARAPSSCGPRPSRCDSGRPCTAGRLPCAGRVRIGEARVVGDRGGRGEREAMPARARTRRGHGSYSPGSVCRRKSTPWPRAAAMARGRSPASLLMTAMAGGAGGANSIASLSGESSPDAHGLVAVDARGDEDRVDAGGFRAFEVGAQQIPDGEDAVAGRQRAPRTASRRGLRGVVGVGVRLAGPEHRPRPCARRDRRWHRRRCTAARRRRPRGRGWRRRTAAGARARAGACRDSLRRLACGRR